MRRHTTALALTALIASSGALAIATASAGASPRTTTVDTPYVGGTLHALGIGDVDYLDPNIAYYAPGLEVARAYSRQLYSYPGVEGQTTIETPDLATAMPTISNGGKTYRITIRTGALWNTTAPRQVSAADVVRGVKTTCNPTEPFGGLADFESDIAGMTKFCNGFLRVRPTAAAVAHYTENTPLPGVKAVSAQTVQFTLTHPTSYFTAMLTMAALSPRPVELDKYLPGSAQEAQHTISDGPYEITSYQPGKLITLNRNPAWSAASDPIRKAYVDGIDITEHGNAATIQQKLKANNPSADVEFDTSPSIEQDDALKRANDPRLVSAPSLTDNPYLVFNTVSPNAKGALRKLAVRRAISYALSRTELIGSTDNESVSHPLTHVLPAGIAGSHNFNDYPHSVAKAKKLLRQSGHPHPTVKLLYRDDADFSIELAHSIKEELKAAGITVHLVGAQQEPFYLNYLYDAGSTRRGSWDIATVGWGPDWVGEGAAASFFEPLFNGRVKPPASSDYGLYNSPVVDSLIDRATRASSTGADELWAKADRKVISDAAVYPIEEPQYETFHSSAVHDFTILPMTGQGDYTNLWLTAPTG